MTASMLAINSHHLDLSYLKVHLKIGIWPFHNFPRTPAQEAVRRVIFCKYRNKTAKGGRGGAAAAHLYLGWEALVGFFTNKVISFIHHWTCIDLPVSFPAKFWKKMAGNSNPISDLIEFVSVLKYGRAVRGPNTECLEPNTECFGPNTECFGPNIEHFEPNTEHFEPNTEMMHSFHLWEKWQK